MDVKEPSPLDAGLVAAWMDGCVILKGVYAAGLPLDRVVVAPSGVFVVYELLKPSDEAEAASAAEAVERAVGDLQMQWGFEVRAVLWTTGEPGPDAVAAKDLSKVIFRTPKVITYDQVTTLSRTLVGRLRLAA